MRAAITLSDLRGRATGPLRTSPAPQTRHAWAATGQRGSGSEPEGAAGKPGHALAEGQPQRLVLAAPSRLHIALRHMAPPHDPGMRVPIRWGRRCATRAAKRNRKPSCAPTRTPTRWTSCAGCVRRWRVETTFEKCAGTSARKPSGNGRLAILRTTPALPACCSRYGQRSSKPRSASYPGRMVSNTRQPMPASSAVNSGPRRFCRLTGLPRRAETLNRRAQPPSAHRLSATLTCKAKLSSCSYPLGNEFLTTTL